jgi:hypothetical protein
MTNRPHETVAPPGSLASGLMAGADFHDAWSIRSSAVERSALGHFMAAVELTPRWVNACMALRNRTVALFGLKNLGHLSTLARDKPPDAYRPGDRVGIFTLFENRPDEALLGDKDKHLDVHVSVHCSRLADASEVLVTVTTVVHVHNLLGRLYMLPVRPMHRIIAPSVLGAISR